MPSTVKVRVKGARNLPPLDHSHRRTPNLVAHAANAVLSPTFHPVTFGLGTSTSSTNSGSGGGGAGGGTTTTGGLGTAGTASPAPDAYVHVSLGGHSSNLIASIEEEELKSGGGSSSSNSNRGGGYRGFGSQFHHNSNTGGGGCGNTGSSNNNHNDSTSNNPTNSTSSSGGDTPQKGYSAKTKVCRRSLNPTWDEEFRFDVTADSMLQDEPLIFRVCNWDAMSTDESIGLVYIDLNPLLSMQAARGEEDDAAAAHRGDGVALRLDAWKGGLSTGVIDGWFPLYDTLGGVRGELGLSIVR